MKSVLILGFLVLLCFNYVKILLNDKKEAYVETDLRKRKVINKDEYMEDDINSSARPTILNPDKYQKQSLDRYEIEEIRIASRMGYNEDPEVRKNYNRYATPDPDIICSIWFEDNIKPINHILNECTSQKNFFINKDILPRWSNSWEKISETLKEQFPADVSVETEIVSGGILITVD